MDFSNEISRGAALFEAGRFEEAADLFRGLSANEMLSRTERIIAAMNLAVTYDKMGHPDTAASTYEFAVGLSLEDYILVQDNRAGFLHRIGRVDEAIAVWEQLLQLEFLAADRADAYRHNISVAKGQRAR